MTMQHRFYYWLLKRLGLFPGAVFNDTNCTIGLPVFITGKSSEVDPTEIKHFSLNASNGDSNTGGSNVDSSNPTSEETHRAFLIPKDGVLDLFNVICNTPPAETETFILTVHVNGVASTLTVTISNPDTSASDLTHSVAVEKDDLVVVKIVGAATSGIFGGQWNVRYVS